MSAIKLFHIHTAMPGCRDFAEPSFCFLNYSAATKKNVKCVFIFTCSFPPFSEGLPEMLCFLIFDIFFGGCVAGF